MFCLINSYRSGLALRSLIGKSRIHPRTFSPKFKQMVAYVDPCNADPCGSSGGDRRQCGPGRTGGAQSGDGGFQICYQCYVDKGIIEHDYKNMTMKRPMSPALEIFRMPMSALMSIWQRITGVMITFYAVLLSGGTLFLANGIETYVSMIQSLNLSETTVMILKFVGGLPFAYHYCNGIRFCLWNMAAFLTKGGVQYTGMCALLGCMTIAGFFAVIL